MPETQLRLAAERARDLVRSAGALIREMQPGVEARDKGGGMGPVTEADLAAESLLLEGLRAHYPGDAVLSEESCPHVKTPVPRLWCVDPLDGTREYADGLPEYAVMMGLLIDGEPAAGALSLPAEDCVYWGWRGGGAWQDGKRVTLQNTHDPSQAVAIHSRNHRSPALREALERLAPAHTETAGSVGYKVGEILRGRAHLYVHARGGTMWWDSVAPAAVLLAAGGSVHSAMGLPLKYGRDLNHKRGLLFAAPGLGEEAARRLRSKA